MEPYARKKKKKKHSFSIMWDVEIKLPYKQKDY